MVITGRLTRAQLRRATPSYANPSSCPIEPASFWLTASCASHAPGPPCPVSTGKSIQSRLYDHWRLRHPQSQNQQIHNLGSYFWEGRPSQEALPGQSDFEPHAFAGLLSFLPCVRVLFAPLFFPFSPSFRHSMALKIKGVCHHPVHCLFAGVSLAGHSIL